MALPALRRWVSHLQMLYQVSAALLIPLSSTLECASLSEYSFFLQCVELHVLTPTPSLCVMWSGQVLEERLKTVVADREAAEKHRQEEVISVLVSFAL